MLLHLPSTTSTMDVAKQLVLQGDTETTVVMADEQTAARGRHNRPWLAFPPPFGFAATFILRPNPGPHLPLLVALALYDALLPKILKSYNPITLKIKWPNDLLFNNKKLAGILCESITDAAGQGAALVGIGLNITPPPSIPETFQGTFLLSNNELRITNDDLANSIWACTQPLLALYQAQGWSKSLHNSYLQRCATIGKPIRWKVPENGPGSAENTELTGLARGLTPSGHLEMVDDDGTVHVIHSGEIFDRSHEKA